MAVPRNTPVPRFAPANSITLPAALDAFGRATDPAWTGDEILADMAPEPSDEELAHRAFKRVTQEASDRPRSATDTDHLPEEHEVLAEPRATDPAWTSDEILADMAPEPTDEELAHRAVEPADQHASDGLRSAIDTDHLPEQHEVLAEPCATDPAWTGDEILADTAPEPSDEELAHRAFKRVTQEASDGTHGMIDTDHLPEEHEVFAELRARRDIEFADRRRWQAAAITFLPHLHQRALLPTAMGSDGMLYQVPPHLWAAENAEALFDSGGRLEIRNGQLVVPRGSITAEDTAIVLVNSDQLQDLITMILEGTPPPLAATVAVPPAAEAQPLDVPSRRKPGRPSPIGQLIEEELRRRAAAGLCHRSLRAEATALLAWAATEHPNEPRMTVEGLENRIRDLYRSLVHP